MRLDSEQKAHSNLDNGCCFNQSVSTFRSNYSERNNSRAICVLGMGRSGTSALARVINLLGVYIGKERDLLPPREANPEGYWEHSAIVDFHDRLLQVFSSPVTVRGVNVDVFPLPEEWWKQPEVEPYRQELKELIQKEFAEHPLWMWKDPVTSLFLPLWKDVLEELRIDVYYVISLRNPLDVHASLKKLNVSSRTFALWQLYNLSCFYWTNKCKRIVVHYDKLLENWEPYLRAIAQSFSIPWPEDDRALRASLAAFLKPELRHSFSSFDSLISGKDVPEPIISAYRLFLEAEKSPRYLNSEEFALKVTNLYKYNLRTLSENNLRVKLSAIRNLPQPPAIIVWGAGSGGSRVLKLLHFLRLDPEFFIDSNEKKWGTTIEGYPVKDPRYLTELKRQGKKLFIIVGSMWFSEITNQLLELGFQPDQDFLNEQIVF